MAVEEFAKHLGLPGLVVAAWYLLERLRIERLGKAEERRLAVEEQRTLAMAEGFRAVSAQIAAHQAADLQSHAEMAETLGEIRGRLDPHVRSVPRLVNGKEG